MDGSNCFALLHVTTWICIEIDEQLIGIIDDWHKRLLHEFEKELKGN
jgi:hypothetical protein